MQPISGNHQLVGYEEDPEHDGGVTEALPQKSAGVVPQNPYFEQQTFSGPSLGHNQTYGHNSKCSSEDHKSKTARTELCAR